MLYLTKLREKLLGNIRFTHQKKYNMKLLRQLNNEYKSKPVMKSFTQYDFASQCSQAEERVKKLCSLVDIRGKRVLEVGCGGGFVSYILARDYECQVTGVDIFPSKHWKEFENECLSFYKLDLSSENPFDEHSFDFVISYVAWEHMKHPFEVLQQCVKVLTPNGKLYILANLYRSPIASHLYRTIYFPFPHLLFDSELVIKYAIKQGVERWWIDAFYFVNKLTYAQYKEYFSFLNLNISYEHFSTSKLDLDFYKRFEDKLGLYPIKDLELNFFEIILEKDSDKPFQHSSSILSYPIKLQFKNSFCDGGYFATLCNETIHISVEAFGEQLMYAWYIFCNEERVETIWYSNNNFIDWTPTNEGYYKIQGFYKDARGAIASDWSEEFKVESQEK